MIIKIDTAKVSATKSAQAQANRRNAYTQESDPLFFKWQRGTATEQEWLDKIAEIKVRYPDPEVPA